MSLDTNKRLERIWSTIHNIPYGLVASYGQVAEISGIRHGARQVVYALRVVPDRAKLPWHRVITVSGKIAFKNGTSAYSDQKKKLMDEGISFSKGRVDMNVFQWSPDLDEILWRPNVAWDFKD